MNKENSIKIKELYLVELKGAYEIAKMFNIHYSTVFDILKREGIKIEGGVRRRKLIRAGKINIWSKGLTKDNHPGLKSISNKLKGKTVRPLEIAPWNKGLTKETDERVFKMANNKETYNKISKSLTGKHSSEETKEKLRQLNSRDKCKWWRGGISFEPYTPEFNKEFKNLIRLRDNFCCLNCGISEQSHLILKGKKLTVHHIDYNKKNTYLQNCCALCNKCNILANINRNEWKDYYQDKLSKLYNYNYNISKIKNLLNK